MRRHHLPRVLAGHHRDDLERHTETAPLQDPFLQQAGVVQAPPVLDPGEELED